jgi:hypothetical protein
MRKEKPNKKMEAQLEVKRDRGIIMRFLEKYRLEWKKLGEYT